MAPNKSCRFSSFRLLAFFVNGSDNITSFCKANANSFFPAVESLSLLCLCLILLIQVDVENSSMSIVRYKILRQLNSWVYINLK